MNHHPATQILCLHKIFNDSSILVSNISQGTTLIKVHRSQICHLTNMGLHHSAIYHHPINHQHINHHHHFIVNPLSIPSLHQHIISTLHHPRNIFIISHNIIILKHSSSIHRHHPIRSRQICNIILMCHLVSLPHSNMCLHPSFRILLGLPTLLPITRMYLLQSFITDHQLANIMMHSYPNLTHFPQEVHHLLSPSMKIVETVIIILNNNIMNHLHHGIIHKHTMITVKDTVNLMMTIITRRDSIKMLKYIRINIAIIHHTMNLPKDMKVIIKNSSSSRTVTTNKVSINKKSTMKIVMKIISRTMKVSRELGMLEADLVGVFLSTRIPIFRLK